MKNRENNLAMTGSFYPSIHITQKTLLLNEACSTLQQKVFFQLAKSEQMLTEVKHTE